jgi:hypothetical protein
MPGTWALFREIARKKLTWGNSTADKPRIDRNLPMDLRIGSNINITSLGAIVEGDKLKIEMPSNDLMVMSYGVFNIDSYVGHRFYLSSDKGELFTLQVVTNKKGEIDDCKLYALHDEIITNDWAFWLDERDGYIGLSSFQLKPEDGGIVYFRAWENETEQVVVEQSATDAITHIPPVEFSEKIYCDPFGNETRRIKHMAMLYGRDISDTVQEYMMVSVADEGNDGASVQIIIGIPVEAQEIKVLF